MPDNITLADKLFRIESDLQSCHRSLDRNGRLSDIRRNASLCERALSSIQSAINKVGLSEKSEKVRQCGILQNDLDCLKARLQARKVAQSRQVFSHPGITRT